MSGKIYLKNGVMGREGFKVKKQEKGTEKWIRYSLEGVRLLRDDGRFFLPLRALEDKVPEIVRDITDGISFRNQISVDPERARGRYALQSASATVDLVPDGKLGHDIEYVVQITSETIEDAKKLYYAIRAGEILPTESWEEEQVEPVFEMQVKFDRGAGGWRPYIEIGFPDGQIIIFSNEYMRKEFHKISNPERSKVIALCEQAIIGMGKGNCPQVYRDLLYEFVHGETRQ